LGRVRLKRPRLTTIYLEEHQIRGFEILSKKEAVPASMLIRRALDKYLESELPRYGIDYRQLLESDSEKILEVTGT